MNAHIKTVTRFLADDRNSSVFMLEIRALSTTSVDVQTYATLRDNVLPKAVVLESLIMGLESSIEQYRKALAELPERSGNEDEPANPT